MNLLHIGIFFLSIKSQPLSNKFFFRKITKMVFIGLTQGEKEGVNFIYVLWAAFTCADPKSTKKTDSLAVFFVLFGIHAFKSVLWNVGEIDIWGQFHQRHMREFFIQNLFWQLFYLHFGFGKKIVQKNMSVKRWWNRHLERTDMSDRIKRIDQSNRKTRC